MLKKTVQISYRRGTQQVSLTTQVSQQTIKNKIHILEFLPHDQVAEHKKTMKHLYMDADEDHIALLFCEKKSGLIKAKNNG